MPNPERRFTETEVADILAHAAARETVESPTLPVAGGLTLTQLQEIGRDVGIDPVAIADSARSIDSRGVATTGRMLGLPLRVQRTVPLPRALTQEEWERVVVHAREIFDAKGSVRSEGSLRQWTNGNLQVLLEPTAEGQRLRIRTMKGNALSTMGVGASFFAMSAFGIVMMTLRGNGGDIGRLTATAILAATGVGMMVVSAIGIVPWARRRREQMAELAERVRGLLDSGPR